MKERNFSPLLAPNEEVNLNELSYPLLVSTKMDGGRILIKNGGICTRSLKEVPSKQINEKLLGIAKYTSDKNIFLDGELYAHNLNFQQIISCMMTMNYTDKNSIKKWNELSPNLSREEALNSLQFHCFDCVETEDYSSPYIDRIKNMEKHAVVLQDNPFTVISQKLCNTPEQIENYFQEVISKGYEGLIIRSINGKYKWGRATLREQIIWKYKPWSTIDSKIIGIVQATRVNEDAEKTITELGRSRTSKRQEDRHLINKANAFIVDYEGKELSVPIAMTNEQKTYIWNHQDEYIGKFVEYKFLKIGMKENGLPRIPKMLRMRPDKE